MNNSSKHRRPIWVWAISIFFFCVGGITLMSFINILTARIPMPADELAVIRQQAKLWTLYGLLPVANIAAAVAIFKMRRIAFYLFSFILAARLAIIFVQLLFSDLTSQIVEGPALTGIIVGFGINIAVCIYSYRLKEEGRLI